MAKPARETEKPSHTYIDSDIHSRFSKLYEFLSQITHTQIFTFLMDIFPWMNAKLCTEAEGYKLIAIVISTWLLPTLKLSCSKGKRERNTTANGEFPGFYHCVKTLSFGNHRFSCKIAQMAAKSPCNAFLNISLVMVRSRIKHLSTA